MSNTALPKWDRNHSVHFWIGMVISLILANIAINYETAIPSYKATGIDELLTQELFQEIKNHSEIQKNDPPSKQIRAIDPSKANLKIVNENVKIIDQPLEPLKPRITESDALINTSNKAEITLPKIKIVNKSEPEIFIMAEKMPCILDCDAMVKEEDRRTCTHNAILTFMYAHLEYPQTARESTIEGTVIVSFVINQSGSLDGISIIRDIGGGCGQAVVNVLKKLQSWSPGSQNNKKVNVKMTIPVKFKLE